MARMKPELRKQELLEIAFRQFLQQGYEKHSIRSIVGEADGEIGCSIITSHQRRKYSQSAGTI
jgi:AcrR family transcriptional regulator